MFTHINTLQTHTQIMRGNTANHAPRARHIQTAGRIYQPNKHTHTHNIGVCLIASLFHMWTPGGHLTLMSCVTHCVYRPGISGMERIYDSTYTKSNIPTITTAIITNTTAFYQERWWFNFMIILEAVACGAVELYWVMLTGVTNRAATNNNFHYIS